MQFMYVTLDREEKDGDFKADSMAMIGLSWYFDIAPAHCRRFWDRAQRPELKWLMVNHNQAPLVIITVIINHLSPFNVILIVNLNNAITNSNLMLGSCALGEGRVPTAGAS